MTPVHWLRLVLFTVLVAGMQWGSFSRIVLDEKNKYFQAWRMYHNRGADQCKLDVWTASDGQPRERRYDWPVLLDADAVWWQAPEVKSQKKALRIGRNLCKTLGPDVEVYLVMTCGKSTGFKKPTKSYDRDLCTEPLGAL